jgi:uncharacterized protein (DUF433 family)
MDTVQSARYLGIGLYTVSDVARIIGETPRKVRRWANGYRFHRAGGERTSEALLTPDFPELAHDGILTFLDLIELRFVAMFRKMGVSMPTIRAAAWAAASLFDSSHPFAVRRFRTDGKRIFAESAFLREQAEPGEADRLLHELPQCQLVMAELAEPFFVKLEYEDELAHQFWPLGRDRRVVIDPSRSFGKPIVHPGSVPTRVLHAMAQAGEAPDAIAWWYRLDEQSVLDAIEYEMSLAA